MMRSDDYLESFSTPLGLNDDRMVFSIFFIAVGNSDQLA
jgi:hypothetical protein